MARKMLGSWKYLALSVMLLALMGGAVACGDDDDDDGGGSEVTQEDLEGRTFTATEAEGLELVEGTELQLTFEDGLVVAIAGCNSGRSTYTIEDGKLIVEGLASTLMACEEELATQDQKLGEFLTSSPDISLDGDELTLSNDEITLTATES